MTPVEPPERAEIGGACESHDDCVAGAHCETDRRCAATPDEEGARCVFGCARGDLFCDLGSLQCRRYGSRGEACDVSGVSAPPCDPAWSFCDGVCRDRPGVGEGCDETARLCVAGARCDAAMATCAAPGATGEPCTADADCADVCVGDICAAYMTCSP
jgi:hypothetical protein